MWTIEQITTKKIKYIMMNIDNSYAITAKNYVGYLLRQIKTMSYGPMLCDL